MKKSKESASNPKTESTKMEMPAPALAPVSQPSTTRREWIILACILLVGLALRLAYLQEIRHDPDFCHPALDPQFNDYWARAMVTGDWTPPIGYPDPMIRTTPHGRPPGYPYFLAFIYLVFGTSYLTPRLSKWRWA